MSDDLSEAVSKLRLAMMTLTDEQRLELFRAIQKGFCTECGCETGEYGCQCWNDE
jgi:hypothetical protein